MPRILDTNSANGTGYVSHLMNETMVYHRLIKRHFSHLPGFGNDRPLLFLSGLFFFSGAEPVGMLAFLEGHQLSGQQIDMGHLFFDDLIDSAFTKGFRHHVLQTQVEKDGIFFSGDGFL